MEIDYPSKNKDGKLPILDLKVWVEENTILYEFYRKDMANRILMMSRSAMPSKIKRNVLIQEAIRILRNCSSRLKWDKIAEILTDFCVRMKLSGYNERYRLNIIQSAPRKWEEQKKQDKIGIRPLYRKKQWNRETRKQEKEMKKKQWFRQDNARFTIFCPYTPNSRLFKMWKTKAEEIKKDSKGRVNAKIIERGGTSLKSQLCKLAPVEQERCNDLSCKVCSSNSNRYICVL